MRASCSPSRTVSPTDFRERLHEAGKAAAHFRYGIGIRVQRSLHGDRFTNAGGAGNGDPDAHGVCYLGVDPGAALVGIVRPFIVTATGTRVHHDIEGMRLQHDAIAAQQVALRLEFEAIDAAAEAPEFDGQVHAVRVDGMPSRYG